MIAVLIFALALLAAALGSGLASRTPASVSVLLLVAGAVAGSGVLGWIGWSPQDPLVEHLARWALVAVLYTDGMRIGLGSLRQAWHLPGRALLLGMPITFAAIAVLAHVLAGLPWLQSLLIAAVLSPTDPVLASAVVERREVPQGLRRLLNVESGMNDGLALPVVLVLLGLLGSPEQDIGGLLIEVAGGAAIGLALPWLARRLRPTPLNILGKYQPLYGLAIGLLVFSVASLFHMNEYLAAFTGGMCFASIDPELRHRFETLGRPASEVLKLLALLMFGALLSPHLFGALGVGGYAFALATLLLARPLALQIALLGSSLSPRQRWVAAWFGPKGFASLVYAIQVLRSDVGDAATIYHLVAVVITLSILLHSSTDVGAARWVQRERSGEPPGTKREQAGGGSSREQPTAR